MNYWIAVILVALAHLLDIISTQYGLSRGAYEANPIVRELGLIPSKFVWMGLTMVVFAVFPRYERMLLTIGVVVTLVMVSAWNFYNYWRLS